MAIRRWWLVLVILLIPAAVQAHDHFADASGGPSYQSGSTLFGFYATFSKTVTDPATATIKVKRVSFLGDFSAHWSTDDSDTWRINFAGGVRYTFAQKHEQKTLPFVHVLLGGSHVNIAVVGDTDPVLTFGTGVEYVFGDSTAGLGLRSQVDYIVRQGEVSPRISVGVVKRWTK
jgi:hypothetical protein